MRLIGFRNVRISSIKLPGGMSKLKDMADVGKMADSFDWTAGQPMEPVVLDQDNVLRAGRHRIAACMLKKLTTVPAMLFEGTEEELARLTDIENAFRRHCPEERDKALARLVVKVAAEPPEGSAKPPRPGRPVTPKGEAIRKVAEATGTTPAAVRSAIARHEAKEEAESPREPEPSELNIPLESWGLPIPDIVQRPANLADIGLREVRKMLTQAARALDQLENQIGRTYPDISGGIDQARSACTAQLPVAVCYACKGFPVVKAQCSVCQMTGFVGKEMHKHASGELAEKGAKAGVYYQGRWHTADQARRLKG